MAAENIGPGSRRWAGSAHDRDAKRMIAEDRASRLLRELDR
jgi:hypothetical protein